MSTPGTCATVVFTDVTAPDVIVQSGPGCIYADVLYVSGDYIYDESGTTVGVDDLQDEAGNSLLTE